MSELNQSNNLPSTTLVIFGVTGDLAKRFLLPALFEIIAVGEIGAQLNILGLSRRDVSVDSILIDQPKDFNERFNILQMDYGNENDYQKLKLKLDDIGSEQIIFYLAIPPEGVLPIVEHLGEAQLNSAKYKLLMEKPFGVDLASAKQLIEATYKHFGEDQIYRIDHYLAKEMAQNIAVFLASNAIFRDIWNNQFIEKIEIVAQESIGIEGRAKLWEATGSLRDFVQSHLMQLAALTLMEPCPDAFNFSMVQPRRLEALKALKLADTDNAAVKGQYVGYREEVGNPSSQTETFAAITLESTDPKWQGVPIQLITGKRLPEKLTEIRAYFKKSQSAQTNVLKLRIQPNQVIELELWIKQPGYVQKLQKLPLDFNYQQYFDHLPDAYEQVIVDAIRSRSNLFASSDEVIASWSVLQPLLKTWDSMEPKIYKPNTSIKEIIN